MTKSGPTYRIQAKLKGKDRGKMNVYSTTWKPQMGMTPKQPYAYETMHSIVHSLRYTNITMQIAAGVPLVTVAGRAGHTRTSTTADIYSHFLKSSDRTAAEKLRNCSTNIKSAVTQQRLGDGTILLKTRKNQKST